MSSAKWRPFCLGLNVLKQCWSTYITLCAAWVCHQYHQVNTLRPRQNWRHFADDLFKCIFMNENARISLKFSLKFVPKVQINNIPALVQIMAWRRPGDKPLSEPMMVSLLTHICVTRPHWVNSWLYCTTFVLQMTTMIADDMLSKTSCTRLLFATKCVLDISWPFFFA